MTRPRLSAALTWPRFESAVHAVFTEALRRLATRTQLESAEEPINFELYWLSREVHYEMLKSTQGSIPFAIMFDSRNQPEPDDTVRSSRLKKRPDFGCVITDPQAADFRSAQIGYYLECKRLGHAEGTWILNENYSEHGVCRFMREESAYAKGCKSAAMIGYIQNMEPEDVLADVNSFATKRQVPSLSKAVAAWAAQDVTRLSQAPLKRAFDSSRVEVKHFWIDLRHCKFEKARPKSDQKATQPGKSNKK
jgi:hypothetical protein